MMTKIERQGNPLQSQRQNNQSKLLEVAKALEGVKGDAVIDGELVALGKDGVSHFQLLQNALRHEAKLLYCVFDLMFLDGKDLRGLSLLERPTLDQFKVTLDCKAVCSRGKAPARTCVGTPELSPRSRPPANDKKYIAGLNGPPSFENGNKANLMTNVKFGDREALRANPGCPDRHIRFPV